MEFCGKQAVSHAANSTRQALDKQPLTERKTPTLTPAVLALLERIQKEKHKPETSSETPKKTGKSMSVSPVKISSGKVGPCSHWGSHLWTCPASQSSKKPSQPLFKGDCGAVAQEVSILQLSEMHTPAEHESLAGNMAKNDSP